MRKTIESGVWIEDEGPEWVIYNNGSERWKVKGVCNCCGLCEVGAMGRNIIWKKEMGEPWAEIDLDYGKRLDIPIRPDIKEHSRETAKSLGKDAECCLEFEWLT